MYRDAHSHPQPPTPEARGTCGRQAEALSTGKGHTGREPVVHQDAQGCHIHMGTCFPDTHRGARKRGRHTQKTEVNRKKTEMESHLEVTEPESRREKDSLDEKTHTFTEAHIQKEGATQMN